MNRINTITGLPLNKKVVLLRADLNVPMQHGVIMDNSRIIGVIPTIKYLLEQNAKVVILSHLGRPKGKFNVSLSLSPLVDELSKFLNGVSVKFSTNCVGILAKEAVKNTNYGEVLLLENLRFHPEEEENDDKFAQELASFGETYINDSFSCSHRAHASILAITQYLPSAAGFLFMQEIRALDSVLVNPKFPTMAVIGGSKISTKIGLLKNLARKFDFMFIGGAMANNFLMAQGNNIGKSLIEPDFIDDVFSIISIAKENNCNLILPMDLVTSKDLEEAVDSKVVDIEDLDEDMYIVDIGPRTVAYLTDIFDKIGSVIWNGPLGIFEVNPFNVSTLSLARIIAYHTAKRKIISIVGGGDSIAALRISGLIADFSYISMAGGAFLEWLEEQSLPGVEALYKL